MCLDSSIIGVLGHGLATLWTFRNELRQKAEELERNSAKVEALGSAGY